MLTPKTNIKLGDNQSFKGIQIYFDQSNHIKVKFPYDKKYIAELKKIPRHKRYPDEKSWSIPFNLENVKRVIGIFREKKINISPELQCRIDLNIKDQQNELPKTNQEVIADLSVMSKVMRLKNIFINHLEFL